MLTQVSRSMKKVVVWLKIVLIRAPDQRKALILEVKERNTRTLAAQLNRQPVRVVSRKKSPQKRPLQVRQSTSLTRWKTGRVMQIVKTLQPDNPMKMPFREPVSP